MSEQENRSHFERDPIDEGEPGEQLARTLGFALTVTLLGLLVFSGTRAGQVAFTLSASTTLIMFGLVPLAMTTFGGHVLAMIMPRAWDATLRRLAGVALAYGFLFAVIWSSIEDVTSLEPLAHPWMWDDILKGRGDR